MVRHGVEQGPALSRRALVAAAAAVFVLACTFGRGGIASITSAGDIAYYLRVADKVLAGGIPYHDFYLEYPPGALPAFLLPSVWESHYATLFAALMAACGLGALVAGAAVLDRLHADDRRRALALGAMAVSPALLGPLFLGRYDLWPALVSVLALCVLLARRERAAFALLALGFAAKVYVAAALPVAAVRVWRTAGKAGLVRATAAFAATSALLLGFFAVVAFGGLGFSFWSQVRRDLHIESLGASLLLGADKLGLYDTTWVRGKPGQIDLAGTLPDVVGSVSTLLQLGAILLVAYVYLRGPESGERLVAAFAASVTAFAVFGKVLSPQFLIWLVPLVPLVGSRKGHVATGLVLASLAVTQVENQFDRDPSEGLRAVDWTVWALLGRNLMLVLAFGLLLSGLAETRRRRSSLRPEWGPS